MLDWCQKKGIDTIMTLEGVNTSDTPEETRTFGVGTTGKTKKMLQTYRISEMREGMVSGISGVLLSEGDRLNIDVMACSVRPRRRCPTPGAPRACWKSSGRCFRRIKLDPQPLMKEAEDDEQQMKTAMESMKQIKKPGEESYLYG